MLLTSIISRTNEIAVYWLLLATKYKLLFPVYEPLINKPLILVY